MRSWSSYLVWSGAIIATAGCATTAAVPTRPSQSSVIPNFQCVAPGLLYRGAQPTPAGMQALKDMGIKTIVSLRVPHAVNAWEADAAGQLDMAFVSLPLSNYGRPNEAKVQEFLRIVTDPTRQPVFVHCRQGQLRTGAMIASYRVSQEGWTAGAAYAEAKEMGFGTDYPWFSPLKRFIQGLKHDEVVPAIPQQTATLPEPQPIPQ